MPYHSNYSLIQLIFALQRKNLKPLIISEKYFKEKSEGKNIHLNYYSAGQYFMIEESILHRNKALCLGLNHSFYDLLLIKNVV